MKSFILLALLGYLATGAILPAAEQQTKEQQPIRYDNYKVYKVTVNNLEQYDQLRGLESELKVMQSLTKKYYQIRPII